MVTNRTVVPPRANTQDTVILTKWQKVIGICLLLFYPESLIDRFVEQLDQVFMLRVFHVDTIC